MSARFGADESSGYDVLVASDAIGMGLNLSIGRVVFSTLTKFDGEDERALTGADTRAGRERSQEIGTRSCKPSLNRCVSCVSSTGSEIRQIAGRAGRFMSQFEEGRVSARKTG
jgi:hypothetical protein